MNILITGCAGFIGFHLSEAYIDAGHTVIGVDNVNSYYDVQLKHDRLSKLYGNNFHFYQKDINDPFIESLFSMYTIDCVVHLAAQAGVRYSITNPRGYIDSNINGFFSIIDLCRKFKKDIIYASSSSVYGDSYNTPFTEEQQTESPVSLYAATKKCNELIAHSYTANHKVNSCGLRFFTVYGSYGRPDMAYYSFTKNIIEGKSIKLYNQGVNLRDFTHVSDIVKSIQLLVEKRFTGYNIFNIGKGSPETTIEMLNLIQRKLSATAIFEYVEKQNGDVDTTYADSSKLADYIGYQSKIDLDTGLDEFIDWYRRYYSA